jgi:hypothetical protein
MSSTVRFYRTEGKNPGVAVVFPDGHGNEWPDRVLKHRGWTVAREVASRQMTEREREWVLGCMRYQACRYTSLQPLIDDELEMAVPQETIETIKARLTLFKCFPEQQGGVQ